MPRAPDERINQAMELYKKGLKLVDIAEELGIPQGTIRRWKSTYDWDAKRSDKNGERSDIKKGGAPIGNKNASRHGAPRENKNAVGHGAPLYNKNAERHGLYAKYLPEECFDFFQAIDQMNPIDMLWDQIKVKYINLMRSQSIMYVKDKEDTTKELKRQKESDSAWEKEYEIQFAWDKQANLLNAQSKATASLLQMIKQYDEMIHKNWVTVTEEQRARIDLMKANIDKIGGTGKEDELADDWLDEVLDEGVD